MKVHPKSDRWREWGGGVIVLGRSYRLRDADHADYFILYM